MHGMQQQIVFSKKASEQQPVPMLVGHCLLEMIDGLTTANRVKFVSQLPAMRPQLTPKFLLFRCESAVSLRAIHGKALQRLLGSVLGDLASAIFSSDGFLKQAAKFF